ncbi:hypothetical protein PPACK8108_LOCUS18196 [Phakopsora pachyrhizi]|uniref:Selenoprotein O n=1 Tax=Phakopsora pachyrhizi TaxID=170000 RepID=A0AAV0BFK0_PHAPC|nr:hypothetical protein PPACK8108_LOCUS18196 [Phakopsora pachyrhizi]
MVNGNSFGLLSLRLTSNLTHHLRPDSIHRKTDNVSSIIISNTNTIRPIRFRPSDLRRSRTVDGAFSFVTPLPHEFPYQLSEQSSSSLEDYLSSLEPDSNVQLLSSTDSIEEQGTIPIGITSQSRSHHFDQNVRPRLIHLSKSTLDDCLPSISEYYHQIDNPINRFDDEQVDYGKRLIELVRILSGEVVIVRLPEQGSNNQMDDDETWLIKSKGFGPWCLNYAGHQFGHFAGQLGDGRAISILSTPSTKSVIQDGFNLLDESETGGVSVIPKLDLQLKGSGRTPYSRFADGLAVLRSSVREYLGSEAAFNLHRFPTSRSLSLISTPGIIVERENFESGSIICRLIPNTWIRIGNFELCRSKEDWIGLRELVDYVCSKVYDLKGEDIEGRGICKSLRFVEQVMVRNAKMVAAWQTWGFMHGVINTDNISILGLTIDYGPYSFMDIYDPNHICNHSDQYGRYSYQNQPEMIKFGILKLGESLAEIIGYEVLKTNETFGKSFEEIMSLKKPNDEDRNSLRDKLRVVGLVEFKAKVLDRFDNVYGKCYYSLMRTRLGLTFEKDKDLEELIEPLLNLLFKHKLDYSITLRSLNLLFPAFKLKSSSIESSLEDKEEEFREFFENLNQKHYDLKRKNVFEDEDDKKEFKDWIRSNYRPRILEDFHQRQKSSKGDDGSEKENNPRFVLRQWVLERLIKSLKVKEESKNQELKNLNPIDEREDRVKEFYCGLGERKFIGFQCSCSS